MAASTTKPSMRKHLAGMNLGVPRIKAIGSYERLIDQTVKYVQIPCMNCIGMQINISTSTMLINWKAIASCQIERFETCLLRRDRVAELMLSPSGIIPTLKTSFFFSWKPWKSLRSSWCLACWISLSKLLEFNGTQEKKAGNMLARPLYHQDWQPDLRQTENPEVTGHISLQDKLSDNAIIKLTANKKSMKGTQQPTTYILLRPYISRTFLPGQKRFRENSQTFSEKGDSLMSRAGRCPV